MKRKFYGVLMLGALAVASASLTSCKDYDDDINNLQTQVNSLSSTVEQKETAIKQLIADLDAAYKKADADLQTAYQQADKDLESGYKAGDVATLAAAKTAIEEAKEALESTISANYESLDAKNKEQDIAIAKAQSDASNALNLLASKANQSDFLVLQNDVQKINTELTKTNAELSQISTALQQAFGDLANLGTALKAQKAALEAVEKLAGQNKADIATNKSAIEVLEKKVATAEEELKKANENIAEANKVIEEVRVAAEARAAKIDSKYETITAMISQDLRSLVYMPTLYMDGIETIEYNYLRDSLLVYKNLQPWEREEIGTTKKFLDKVDDYQRPTTIKDFVFGPAWPVYYHQNPSIAKTAYENVVGYYAYDVETITRATDKPANRSSVWEINSPEKYVNGDQLFENGAILTAGLQIKKPHLIGNLKDNPNTSYATHPNLHSNNDVIVAFQAKSRINNVDTIITSDYAMLYPEKVWVEGLIWRKGTTSGSWPTYWYKDNQRIQNFWNNDRGYATAAPNGLAPYPYRTTTQSGPANHDWACPWTNAIVHVWDNPKDALMHPADIELFVNDLDGVDLIQYMGVHFVHESITKAGLNRHPGEWAWNDPELKHFGLQWYVDVVDYTATDRTHPEMPIRTHDSRYCELSKPIIENNEVFVNNTTITAKDVIDRDGLNESYDDPVPTDGSRASVGREPLVRIRLFHKETSDVNKVNQGKETPILDGYIRVRISQPELKEVEYPAFQTETFDLCNALSKETNWILFNQKVLHDGLDLEREQFNALYAAEYKANPILVQYSKPRSYSNLTAGDNGTEYYGYYNETGRNLVRAQENGKYYITQGEVGTIEYRDNYQGTTNDAFLWTISEAELEFITHDLPVGTEVTIERYVHFTGHFEGNRGAKYDDVFLKFTRTIVRDQIDKITIKEKNIDYWKTLEGCDAGKYSIAMNTPYPEDEGITIPWRNDISATFIQNAVKFTAKNGSTVNGSKFYFVPIETEIKTLNGKVYVITPRRGCNDNVWNKFFDRWIAGHTHDYAIKPAGKRNTDTDNSVVADETKNNDTFSICTILFEPATGNKSEQPKVDGVFSNDTLYAVEKNAYSSQKEYTPIVIMKNPTNSGETELLHQYVINQWLDGAAPNKTASSVTDQNEGQNNEVVFDLVNAVGYDLALCGERGGNPLSKQLRGYVGVIASTRCNLATQMTCDLNQFATFQSAWERPINVEKFDTVSVDAKNNAEYFYAVDFLKIYDWRGPVQGPMWGDSQWLWSYYNIKAFTLDLRPASVTTDMHNHNGFVPMNTISTKVRLTAGGKGTDPYYQAGKVTHTADFALRNNVNWPINSAPWADPTNYQDFDRHDSNTDIIRFLGINNDPVEGIDPVKGKFGWIKYENNGENVEDFSVRVPVAVTYEWGTLTTTVEIFIKHTKGHGNGDNN